VPGRNLSTGKMGRAKDGARGGRRSAGRRATLEHERPVLSWPIRDLWEKSLGRQANQGDLPITHQTKGTKLHLRGEGLSRTRLQTFSRGRRRNGTSSPAVEESGGERIGERKQSCPYHGNREGGRTYCSHRKQGKSLKKSTTDTSCSEEEKGLHRQGGST